METILKHLEEIVDAWIKLEKKLGLKKILGYVFLVGFILLAINIKTVTLSTLEFVSDMQEELHNIKMEKRDQLLAELYPILVEYRTSVGADRLLYFEYHNSKENLVGIPFKFMDLITQSTRYGVSPCLEGSFKDINVGAITNLYEEMNNNGSVIYCMGQNDASFRRRFPGAMELFTQVDQSKKLAFVSIPGIRQPIGMVILEWTEDSDIINIPKVDEETSKFIPGINALILSKR